jgi:hypothetical protein
VNVANGRFRLIAASRSDTAGAAVSGGGEVDVDTVTFPVMPEPDGVPCCSQ